MVKANVEVGLDLFSIKNNMKTRKNKDNNIQVNQGFSLKDQNYLKKYDNAAADPTIQMFTEEELDEEPEQRIYFCAFCKSK